MRDQGNPSNGSGLPPLWTDGDMMFRIAGLGTESDRLVKIHRPFALIGRGDGADIVINNQNVSVRHVYLHLDPRGVYAIDLVTRTGTRLMGEPRMVGWLRPGDWLEVAGRRVELVRMRIGGVPIVPPETDDDLLADTERPGLMGVTLEPRRPNDSPWVLGSELVFLGWSASCGIPVKDPSVARTHGALVRAANGAYLVDLCGRQTWVEDKPVTGASMIQDGDMITLGSTQFTARIDPPALAGQSFPALRIDASLPLPVHTTYSELMPSQPFALDPSLIPSDVQSALLGWMMGTIQGGQGELLRRQGEFQLAISQVLRQIQQDNATLLSVHLQRVENIASELSALRTEIERRGVGPAPRPMPNATPLRIARPAPNNEPDAEPKAPTAWLLQRVNQLETENRSAWKDLLGRLTPNRRAT